RLTAWELMQDDIPVTLIADVAAGFLMSEGSIDAVIVGADRIAANGDTANKIGTYQLAVLAEKHRIPFYVAAPTSTVDLLTSSAGEIVIEERDAAELTSFAGHPSAPENVRTRNPVFDVTPADLIDAIITEKGISMKGDHPRRLKEFVSA
ncbi:MAG: S-methyl-5-thioribose-1-phosphate isomerase, partial [Gemmatimonadales bacterium]